MPFPHRSPPGLLTRAAGGGLQPPPARRLRGAVPHLVCSKAASECSRHMHSFAPSWRTVIGIPAVVQASEGGVVGIAGWIVRPEFLLVENFLFPLPSRGVVALLERCVHPFPQAIA